MRLRGTKCFRKSLKSTASYLFGGYVKIFSVGLILFIPV